MTKLIEALSSETGLRSLDIHRIMNRAPVMYKTFFIEKRSGDLRLISQPSREVKFLQRALMNVLLADLPIHECATAYRTGHSLLANAAPHAGDGPILKIDLTDFFPSIRSVDWVSYCKNKNLPLSDEEISLTSRLLFHRKPGTRTLSLAVGAPSSPMLSNILMHDFDALILENRENAYVRYTRYADDMTFSAPRTGHLNGVFQTVAKTIRATAHPSLSINIKKTTYATRKYGRSVTGLTLANDGRVTIGHKNKRKIHAAIYNAKLGKSSREELQITAGMLAYVNSVEPEFLNVLRRRYGVDVIDDVKRMIIKGRRLDKHAPPLARILDTEHPLTEDDFSNNDVEE